MLTVNEEWVVNLSTSYSLTWSPLLALVFFWHLVFFQLFETPVFQDVYRKYILYTSRWHLQAFHPDCIHVIAF